MNNLKEFEAGFIYDSQDLSSQGVGSGVHKQQDVEIVFNVMDRNGELLRNKNDIIKSNFCDGIVFDITDENANIVEANFQSGFSNKLVFTKENNESVFGHYKKDFGIIATVVDHTSIYNPSGYISLYGNNLEISGIQAIDSRGSLNYTESIGVFFSGNLQPSGYLYTGKMYPVGDSQTPLKYKTSGEIIHEGSPYPWEAYMSWEYNSGELSGYISYDTFKTELESFSNQGSWSLVVMDYSPNESFLVSSGSKDFHNPFGSYIDNLGSGYIVDVLQQPDRIATGIIDYQNLLTGQLPDDRMQLRVDFMNSPEYTEFSHMDMYAYKGNSLDLNKFQFIKRIENVDSPSLRTYYAEDYGMEYNQKTWLKFRPYSKIGKGEAFVVGPLTVDKVIDPDDSTLVSSAVKISSSGSSANINYKERDIDLVLYSGSGVLDKIFIDQENPETQVPIYEPFSTNPEYYSLRLDENGKWENTTFEYIFEFRERENFYSVESRKITLSPTGQSQESGNFGYPLFKIKDDKEVGDYVDFGITYENSGVMLLCNTSGHQYDVYKYYKTSI